MKKLAQAVADFVRAAAEAARGYSRAAAPAGADKTEQSDPSKKYE